MNYVLWNERDCIVRLENVKKVFEMLGNRICNIVGTSSSDRFKIGLFIIRNQGNTFIKFIL